MKVIEPSLLAFDIHKIPQQLTEIKNCGFAYIHYDVMDGRFVTNTAFQTEWLELINKSGLKANVHFMVQNPDEWIDLFKTFPINSLVFHCEAINPTEINECLNKLHNLNIAGGIAIKPDTDANAYKTIIQRCNYVCVMGVQPGMGGQSFMTSAMENLIKVYEIKKTLNPNLIIQLDGGVNPQVISQTAKYVDHFVVGSYLMKLDNKKSLIEIANKY